MKKLVGGALFVAVAIYLHARAPLMWFYDTISYRAVAAAPLHRLFIGERPPGMPILLHLAPSENAFTWWQLGLYVAGALALAWAVTRWLESERAQGVAFLLTLLVALMPQIFCWNRTLGSESLTNSLLFWGLALASVVARPPRDPRLRWAALGGLVLVAAYWTLVRDANGYFLVFLCGAAFLARRRVESGALLAFAVVLCLVCGHTADRGGRFKWPFVNVLGIRIMPDLERRQFFVERGLPLNPKTLCFSGQFGSHCGMDLSGFGRWLDGDIQGLYARYLLSHPIESLIAPARHLGRLIYLRENLNGIRIDLMYLFPQAPSWQRVPGITFFERNLMMALLLVGFGWSWRRSKRERFRVPLLLMASVLPMIFLVWHADEAEVMRHSVVPALIWRLGLLLGIAIGVDTTSSTHTPPTPPPPPP